MQIAKLKAGATMLKICGPGPLPIPRGIVGATVSIEYDDPVWEGLHKTLVFRGAADMDVLDPGGTVAIPWETVALAGKHLLVGLYGTDALGELVIPTVWADLGEIRSGADPSGDTSADPSLPVWAQLQNQVEALAARSTTFTPAVDADGNLSWTNNAGMENPETVNIKGEAGADGVSPVVTVTKSGSVTTIAITDAEGTKTATVYDGVDGVGGSGDTSGTSGVFTLLGQTPQTLSSGKTVKLSCDEECSYSVRSDTVADFDISGGTLVGASLSTGNGYFQLAANASAAAFYNSYVEMTAGGLTVGESYNFVFDAVGIPWDDDNHITIGHYILYDGNGSTLVARGSTDGCSLNAYAFTATTENVRLRWYSATNSNFAAGVSVAGVNAIYINREDTKIHTEIVDMSGSFNGATLLGSLPAGVSIESEPACDVFIQAAAGSSGTQSRHAGKICVCFGDSVTGNMDAPYDYPSVLAEETGMEVVNAGFGGCRMSDTHPTACYAAFSMVKLAEAVAGGDWTEQDSLVGDMSEVTNAAEHLTALKAVDWSNVAFVTVAYGTNDIQGGVAIDDETDAQSVTTYLGALRYALSKLLTAYPYLKVLLLTPIYRYWDDEGVDSDEKTFSGNAFTDWGDGLLAVAEKFKIPAVDMYRTMGFNSITRSYYYPSTDGTHPNANGMKAIAGKIAGKLLAEY